MREWIFRWGPALATMTAIFVASSVPGSALPPQLGLGWDKVLHAGEFAVVAAALYWALRGGPRAALLAAAAAIAYGVADELHQALVPGRFADPIDVIADAVGAVFGVALARAVWIRSREDNGDSAQLSWRDPVDRS